MRRKNREQPSRWLAQPGRPSCSTKTNSSPFPVKYVFCKACPDRVLIKIGESPQKILEGRDDPRVVPVSPEVSP